MELEFKLILNLNYKLLKIEDYQLHEAAHQDPFAGVKVETEKEFEELKIDDFSHRYTGISPGPDNQHTGV